MVDITHRQCWEVREKCITRSSAIRTGEGRKGVGGIFGKIFYFYF